MAESRLLDVIGQRGAVTQRELARILDVSPQAVHQQVRRLELHGRIVQVEESGKRRWTLKADAGAR